MKKIYVLDTNILLSNHKSIFSFDEHTVVIPLVVLEELDNIKMRKNDLSRDARAAIRTLEDIIGDGNGDLQEGILMSSSGVHKCHEEAKLIISKLPPETIDIKNDCPDNIIINTAQDLQAKYGECVVLVSNDINCRLKARGAGVKNVQKLKSDVIVEDTDYLPQGVYEVDSEWINMLSEHDSVKQKSCGGIIIPSKLLPIEGVNPKELIRSWFYNESSDWAAQVMSCFEEDDQLFLSLKFKKYKSMVKRNCSGIKPKNVNQAIAIDALLDKDVDLVVLFGAAGSGKTLIAMAAGTEMVRGKHNSKDEIIFGKTMDSQFEQIGFLPGNEHEKVAPWVGAVYDNMEVISKINKNEELHPRNSIEEEGKSFIKLKNLGFMRGRSINDRVLIIDESQNLNAKQIKTLLTRAGENTKVIVMGNLAQIDNDYVSENSSGLTYVCKKFAAWDRATIVHLEGVERSPLAGFAETNL